METYYPTIASMAQAVAFIHPAFNVIASDPKILKHVAALGGNMDQVQATSSDQQMSQSVEVVQARLKHCADQLKTSPQALLAKVVDHEMSLIRNDDVQVLKKPFLF